MLSNGWVFNCVVLCDVDYSVEKEMKNTSIECSNVSVEYDSSSDTPIKAVDGITFAVGSQTITGILGVNGAGKTSTIRVLTGLRRPHSGKVLIEGHDIVSDPKAVKRFTGVSFGGSLGLYGRLSAFENCELFALLAGSNRGVARKAAERVLQAVELSEYMDRAVEQLSAGMKQRVHLARALVNEPTIVYLDEPTAGLDPFSAGTVRSLIPKIREEGKTVVLTTHLLHEADLLCDQVIIMDQGRIIDQGPPASLKERYTRGVVLELYAPEVDLAVSLSLADNVRNLFPQLVAIVEGEVVASGVNLTVRLRPSIIGHDEIEAAVEPIEQYLATKGPHWRRTVRPSTLEEAFLTAITTAREGQ